jgi:ubiquinone/menaquinone biosynthesis C-methylase UbiE
MKVRDSGMPEQSYWEGLFDIGGVLDALKIDREVNDAIEVGCGYGTFTLPLAQRIRGTLHAFDIEPEMVKITEKRATAAGIKNLRLVACDVIAAGFDLPPKSVDAVLLFNILHADDPVGMLRAAGEVVRPGGRVIAIHWRSDVKTPRGPDLSIRPKPEQIATWATSVGLRPQPSQLLPPWHFGIVLLR